MPTDADTGDAWLFSAGARRLVLGIPRFPTQVLFLDFDNHWRLGILGERRSLVGDLVVSDITAILEGGDISDRDRVVVRAEQHHVSLENHVVLRRRNAPLGDVTSRLPAALLQAELDGFGSASGELLQQLCHRWYELSRRLDRSGNAGVDRFLNQHRNPQRVMVNGRGRRQLAIPEVIALSA